LYDDFCDALKIIYLHIAGYIWLLNVVARL